MLINQWLKEATDKLSESSGTPQLDAEVMLANLLTVDRSWVHSHYDNVLSKDNLKILNTYIKRRATHEPLAYILNESEFYGRKFYITNGVLVPRPESEIMIDMLKDYCKVKNLEDIYLVDVGTGSGALIVSASLEINASKALAIDIDEICFKVARKNIKQHGLEITVKKGNLLEPLLEAEIKNYNLVILANLPYVPNAYPINSEAQNEPKHAIFGGDDGLDLFRNMFEQLDKISSKSVSVFTECLPQQHAVLKEIAELHKFTLTKDEDFIQVFTR